MMTAAAHGTIHQQDPFEGGEGEHPFGLTVLTAVEMTKPPFAYLPDYTSTFSYANERCCQGTSVPPCYVGPIC